MTRSPNKPQGQGKAARVAATTLLSAILDGRKPLDGLLDPEAGERAYLDLPVRDRRLVHAIVGTALRRHGETDALLGRLVERRPRRAGQLFRILEIAIAQLLFMDVPDHAAVSIALDQLDDDRDGRHFKPLANAVLRRIARERDEILADAALAARNTPDWLAARWTRAYGADAAREIAAAHLVEPSLDLTVRHDPSAEAARLGGIALPTGTVRLVPSGPVEDLPGYAEGDWWVQDAAAALPARLLGDVAGKEIADLCAAPGGKTSQLAAAGARVTAVDLSRARLDRLQRNLDRLRLIAEVVAADVLAWQPDRLFDAILLDAPCTATGTIRRHPDISWLKREEDVGKLAGLQSRMIDRVIPWLKPGGVLVYCTCSLEGEEGESQAARALGRHPLDRLPVAPAEVGGLAGLVSPEGYVRTLPSHLPFDPPRLGGLDGFFIARFRRR